MDTWGLDHQGHPRGRMHGMAWPAVRSPQRGQRKLLKDVVTQPCGSGRRLLRPQAPHGCTSASPSARRGHPRCSFQSARPSKHRWEGPQGVASTPHLPEALLTLFPPDPSASRLHPVVQLPCFLLGGLPGTPQPAAPPPPPPSSLCSSTAWRSWGHPERPGCQAGKPGAATSSHSLNGTVAGSKETCKAI